MSTHALCRAALLALAATSFLAGRAAAYPVSTTFTIDRAQSPLRIDAKATFIFTFRDFDVQQIEGTIDATFDFGASGAFPASATVNVTGSAITHDTPFVLDLGPAHTVVTGLLADVTTINPPAPLTKNLQPGAVYNYDASRFLITLVDGKVVTTGFVNETTDLSEQDPPVAGSAPAGTIGTVAFAIQSTSGFYSLVNATMNFPIDVAETIPVGNINVDIELTGQAVAHASFYVALAGVPGDFTQDGRVDDADFTAWKTGLGKATGATLNDGDANADGDVDGADFLVWQRNYGTAPPPLPGFAAVPEPATACLIACSLAAWLGRSRRRQSAPAGGLSPPCDPRG